jgi:glycerol-3-phosphate acyltransferase PlsY
MNAYGLGVMLLLAYLIGATPTSYVAARLGRGIDLREHGSHNLGVAAVVGHVASPYVRFRGGKGVATAAGMFLALAPLAIALSVLIWAATLWLTGYVSVASLTVAVLFPVWVWLTVPAEPYTVWAAVAVAALIVYAHRANIRRLSAGSEHRFRTRKGLTA